MKCFRSFIVFFLALSCSNFQNEPQVKIGNYYADILHGITFKYDNNQAFLFRIGYVDRAGNYIKTYRDHKEMLPDESGQKFGPSAPDYTYNKFGFTTGTNNIIWIEWSKLDKGDAAVGKIFSESPQNIYMEAMQAWPGSKKVFYRPTEKGISGWLDSASLSGPPDWEYLVLERKTMDIITAGTFGSLHSKIEKGIVDDPAKLPGVFPSIATKHQISANEPLYFVAGKVKNAYTPEMIDSRLDAKLAEYNNKRFSIETPEGELWEAVSNHLNHSRVFGTQSRLTANVVSRGWCGGYNQQLYEWDSFFHALLTSIEDPEGGKETVRAILFHQTKEGIVPNAVRGNDTTYNTNDRSQPPVGSICVWKMHQYHPDVDFLNEVYPKLLKWHNWWFGIRPENGLPYRDGNKNGLLEWGTEVGTWLQGAKYESGQDNSPMFDDARMNEKSRTMELDMAGLSGLWAADALYLSYIAEAIGKPDDAEMLSSQVKEINQKMNEILWDDKIGMYCNKYWDEYSRKPKINSFNRIPTFNIVGDVSLSHTDQNGNIKHETIHSVGLDKKQITELGLIERVYADKYSREENPVTLNFSLKVEEPGAYFFYTAEEWGVLLEVDGQSIIDNRKYWITEFMSDPIYLEEDRVYDFKLDYTGDIPFELLWAKEQMMNGDLFSERLGPTLFYPLISGAPDSRKAKMIIENLTDTNLFWGEYVIPTIARNDPAFPSQGYWRGRIWPPTNYLAYLGINNYAKNEITWQFALKSAKIAQNEWRSQGHLHENYDASGPGTGTPHYCWGGLMQLILLEELMEIDEEGKINSNPMLKGNYVIRNFPLNGEIIVLKEIQD